MQTQISGLHHTQAHEPNKVHNPSSESQLSNMQRYANQPVPAPGQGGTSVNRGKQIPFGTMLPLILPELDKDKAMQLQTLYGKLRVCFYLLSITLWCFPVLFQRYSEGLLIS